jgi:hypothetical protein
MNDKGRKFYDSLVSEGKKLPDYETFKISLQDKDKSKKFYDALTKEGKKLPDFEKFYSTFTQEPTEQVPTQQETSTNQPLEQVPRQETPVEQPQKPRDTMSMNLFNLGGGMGQQENIKEKEPVEEDGQEPSRWNQIKDSLFNAWQNTKAAFIDVGIGVKMPEYGLEKIISGGLKKLEDKETISNETSRLIKDMVFGGSIKIDGESIMPSQQIADLAETSSAITSRIRETKPFIESLRSGNAGDIAIGAVEGALGYVPSIILGAATGGTSFIPMFAGSEFVSSAEMKADLTDRDIRDVIEEYDADVVVPMVTGAVAGMLEKYGLTKAQQALLKPLTGAKAINVVKDILVTTGRQGVINWLEAGLSQLTIDYARTGKIDESIKHMGEWLVSEDGASAGLQAAAGTLLTGGLGKGTQAVFSRKLKAGDQDVSFLEDKDGAVYERGGLTKAEAEDMASKLSERYPNISFEVKDITDKEDPYAETNFTVESKPKQEQPKYTQNEETIDKKSIEEAIENAETIEDLEGIGIENDSELESKLSNKFKEISDKTKSELQELDATTEQEQKVDAPKISEQVGNEVTVNIGGRNVSGTVVVDEGGKVELHSGNRIYEIEPNTPFSEFIRPVNLSEDGGINVNGEDFSEARIVVEGGQKKALLIREDGTTKAITNPRVVEEIEYQVTLAEMESMTDQEADRLWNQYEESRKQQRQTEETTQEGVVETDEEIRLREAIEEIELIEELALEDLANLETQSRLVEFTPPSMKEPKVYLVKKNKDGSYSATLNGRKVARPEIVAKLGNLYESQTGDLVAKLQEQTNKLKQEVEENLYGRKKEQSAEQQPTAEESVVVEDVQQEPTDKGTDTEVSVEKPKNKEVKTIVEESTEVKQEAVKGKKPVKLSDSEKSLIEKGIERSGTDIASVDVNSIVELADKIAKNDGKERKIEHVAEALQYSLYKDEKGFGRVNSYDLIDVFEGKNKLDFPNIKRMMELGVAPKDSSNDIKLINGIQESFSKLDTASKALFQTFAKRHIDGISIDKNIDKSEVLAEDVAGELKGIIDRILANKQSEYEYTDQKGRKKKEKFTQVTKTAKEISDFINKPDAKPVTEETPVADVSGDTRIEGKSESVGTEKSDITVNDSRPRVTFEFLGEEMTGTKDGEIIIGDDGTKYREANVSNLKEIPAKDRLSKQKEAVKKAFDEVKKTFNEGNKQGVIYDFEKAAKDDIRFYNALRNLVVEYARLKGMQFDQAIDELSKILKRPITKKNKDYVKTIWDEVTAKKPPVQQSIKKATESKPSREKYTLVNAYTELKRSLRERAKASRQGVKSEKDRVNSLRGELESFIKDNAKEINVLGAKLSTAILRRVNNINSELGLDRTLDYIDKILSDQKLRNEISDKNSLIDKIKSETDPSKQVKRESGVLKSKRKQTAEGISVLKWINKALGMNRVYADTRIQALQQELLDHQMGNLELTPEQVFKKQTEMYALNFADLESMPINIVKQLLDEVKSIKQTDRIDAIDRVKQWNEKIQNNISETVKVLDPDNKAGKPSWLMPKLKPEGKLSWIKEGLASQPNWIWLLDKLSKLDKASKPLQSFLNKKFEQELVSKPNREQQVSTNKIIREIQDKFSEIFNAKKPSQREKILTENSTPKPFTYTDTNGEKQTVEMSINAIYKRWMEMQDDTLLPTFEGMNMGVDYLQQLENAMTPEVKAWAEWQLNEFYPKYAESVNKIYKDVFGIDMPIRDNYSPIRRVMEKVSDDTSLTFSGQQAFNSVNNGSLKDRVGSKLPLMEMDGDKVLMNYIYQMEFFKSHALPLKELSQSLLNRDVLTRIDHLHGPEFTKALKSHIDSFYKKDQNRGTIERIMERLRKNFTVSTLAVNPVSFIKQLTSIPAYSNWIPAEQWALRTAKFWANPVKNAQFLLDNSEYMQLRLETMGFDRDAAAVMSKDWKRSISGQDKLANQMMFMTKWGDSAAIFIGGYAVYDYHYEQAIKRGATPQEAKAFAISEFERATELTQQASDSQNLNLFQKGSEFMRVMTMYKTSPIAYHSLAMGALRNLKYGRGDAKQNIKQFALFHMALPMVFQWASSAFLTPSGEDDPDFWFKMGRSAIFGNLNSVFMAGDFMEYLWKSMIEGEPFDYSLNTTITSLFSNMLKTGDLTLKAADEINLLNILTAIDQAFRTISQFTPQIAAYNQVSRVTEGIMDATTGETDHPIRRSLGWSSWALGENKYQNRQKNKLLEMIKGKDYKKKSKRNSEVDEFYDFSKPGF